MLFGRFGRFVASFGQVYSKKVLMLNTFFSPLGHDNANFYDNATYFFERLYLTYSSFGRFLPTFSFCVVWP